MNAKRATQSAQGIAPDESSIPSGAVVAHEMVFQQLAFEALAMSILRGRGRRDPVGEIAPER